MIRGTTPTHSFYIPFSVDEIEDINVIYGQNDTMLFKKAKEDCLITNNKVVVSLTADETLLFDERKTGQAQIEVVTTEGKTQTSDIVLFPVCKRLKEV